MQEELDGRLLQLEWVGITGQVVTCADFRFSPCGGVLCHVLVLCEAQAGCVML